MDFLCLLLGVWFGFVDANVITVSWILIELIIDTSAASDLPAPVSFLLSTGS